MFNKGNAGFRTIVSKNRRFEWIWRSEPCSKVVEMWERDGGEALYNELAEKGTEVN